MSNGIRQEPGEGLGGRRGWESRARKEADVWKGGKRCCQVLLTRTFEHYIRTASTLWTKWESSVPILHWIYVSVVSTVTCLNFAHLENKQSNTLSRRSKQNDLYSLTFDNSLLLSLLVCYFTTSSSRLSFSLLICRHLFVFPIMSTWKTNVSSLLKSKSRLERHW